MTKINRPKALIRKVLRDRTKEMSAKECPCGEVLDLRSWPAEWKDRLLKARKIAAYMPLSDELSVDNLVNEVRELTKDPGKICFPKVEGEALRFFLADEPSQFRTGAFHIEEPAESCIEVLPEEIDIVLVPAVAYGKNGTRLGRGKGFYDRFIHQIFESCGTIEGKYLIGVIPQRCILGAVPSDPWDMKVDALVTEKGFIETPCVCGTCVRTIRNTAQETEEKESRK